MSQCRIKGCTEYAGTICSGGAELVEWICASHRKSCSCHGCGKYRATAKRDGSLDTDYKECVLCPHCGAECQDEYESGYISQALQGDTFDVECNACDRIFEVEPHISVKYSTTKKEDCDHLRVSRQISSLYGGTIKRCRDCGEKLEDDDAEDDAGRAARDG